MGAQGGLSDSPPARKSVLAPHVPRDHGSHEGYEGYEGDEGDEGHEGHEGYEGDEGQAGLRDRQGGAREVRRLPWHQGEDLHRAEEVGLGEEQAGAHRLHKASANGKKLYANIKGWTQAVQKARKALGVQGFKAVKKGTPLYTKAKEIYGQ